MRALGPGLLLVVGLLGGGGGLGAKAVPAPAPAFSGVGYRPLPPLLPVPASTPSVGRAVAPRGNPAVCIMPEIPECPRAAFLVRVAATNEKYMGQRKAARATGVLFEQESPSCLRLQETAAACGGYVKLASSLAGR